MKKIMICCLILVLLLSGCRAGMEASPADFECKDIKTDYLIARNSPQTTLLHSAEQAAAYYSEVTDISDLNLGNLTCAPSPDLEEQLASYDEAFFEENDLLVIAIECSSGGDRYTVSKITRHGNKLEVTIEQTQVGNTCDMSGCHILVSLSKSLAVNPDNIDLDIKKYHRESTW